MTDDPGPVQEVSPLVQRRQRKLSDWHYEWSMRHKNDASFHPEGRKTPSDYNQHYVDINPPREIENEFHRRANEIMGNDPETGDFLDPPTPQQRSVGSLLAGALGDAFGSAIKSENIASIRERYGERGLTEQPLQDGVARISCHTQMMLFTVEGLIRANVARRINPQDLDPTPEIQHACQRWLHTQGYPWEQAGGPYAQRVPQPDGWLITNRGLFSQRDPEEAWLSAGTTFSRTGAPLTVEHGTGELSGGGAVTRAPMLAGWGDDPERVFRTAVQVTALTHTHPLDYLPAGFLALLIHNLLCGRSLKESMRRAGDEMLKWPGSEEPARVLRIAYHMSKDFTEPVSPKFLRANLGLGRNGAETVAIGLYAALATDYVREALLLSVNHSGDSAATGYVCGTIVGALYGERSVPPILTRNLELRDVIQTLAQDELAEFGPNAPTDPSWLQRYPAW